MDNLDYIQIDDDDNFVIDPQSFFRQEHKDEQDPFIAEAKQQMP